MTDLIRSEDPAQTGAVIAKHRCSGRLPRPYSRLIELLRGRHYVDVAQEQAGVPREPVVDADRGEDGALAPARGIVVGVLLSAAIWAALALALWALTRH
jgi:hypothetical protein